jgi:hypothetical protein
VCGDDNSVVGWFRHCLGFLCSKYPLGQATT